MSGFEVRAVTSEEVLFAAWDQLGYDPPGKGQYPEAIAKGDNIILIGWLGDIAVTRLNLRMIGIRQDEPQVAEVVSNTYPNEHPIPSIYGLRTHRDYLRKGYARQTVIEAENQIIARPNVVKRAVLSVAIDNKEAVPLYQSLEYEIIGTTRVTFPVQVDGGHASDEKDVYVMAKDLSAKSEPA